MTQIASHFGMALRELLVRHGWSQEMLAAQANLNRSYIGELERGESQASLATVAKLAAALGLRMSELLVHTECIAQSRSSRSAQLMPIAG